MATAERGNAREYDGLFRGKCFWLSRSIPSRKRLVELIQVPS